MSFKDYLIEATLEVFIKDLIKDKDEFTDSDYKKVAKEFGDEHLFKNDKLKKVLKKLGIKDKMKY